MGSLRRSYPDGEEMLRELFWVFLLRGEGTVVRVITRTSSFPRLANFGIVDLVGSQGRSNFIHVFCLLGWTLSLEDMMVSSPIYLLSKASKTKFWLWHRRLSHLNFDYITTLAKQGLVHGLPRLKFQKDHLCSTCALEAVAIACFTQNRSLIQKRHNKTPYELLYNKKPDLSYFHVFGALCYPTNDSEDLGKLKPKAYIGIFVGYAPTKKALGPEPQLLTPETLSSGLVPNPSLPTPYVPPTKRDWDMLLQPMFDEYFNPLPCVASSVPAVAALVPANLTGSPSSTPVDQDAPSPSTSQTPQASQPPVASQGVVKEFHDIEVAHLNNDPFFNVPIPEPNSKESSSRDVILTNGYSVNQPPEHLSKWTKDHPLDNVIGNPS
ncbi:integrase, catalytic region, zinc finger, CCHC-type containing protein [Tanacetum coccineum]